MTGIPGPFARDYAFQQLLAGNPSSMFNMIPAAQPYGSPQGAPMSPPPNPFAADYAAQGMLPAAQTYGAPQGAPMSPPPPDPFAADYAAMGPQGAPMAPPGVSTAGPADTLSSTLQSTPGSTPAGGMTAQQIQNIGTASSIASAFVAIVGAVGSAMVSRENLKAQGDTLEHQAFMSSINARRAERQAAAIMEQGRDQIAQMTAEAGQVKAKQVTSAAARGVEIGRGSARDITDTTEIVKEVERLAINRASVERAGAARMQATDLMNQSLLARVGAGNLRRSARQISPAAAGGQAFISSVGQFANQQASYMRRR